MAIFYKIFQFSVNLLNSRFILTTGFNFFILIPQQLNPEIRIEETKQNSKLQK